MKFGQVPYNALPNLDLRLPSDSPFTTAILKASNNTEPLKTYVGCAKWGITEWVGKIYPTGTKSTDFLHHYANQFNALELNATFYEPKKLVDMLKWHKATPANFTFCPKFERTISHEKQLVNVEEATDTFLTTMEPIKDKIGYYLLQLSDSFAPKQQAVLITFAERIQNRARIVVELRNPDWFKSNQLHEIFSAMAEMKIPMVITDTPGRRDCIHQYLTTTTAFIRFAGTDLHPTCLKRLEDWAIRIRNWKEMGLKELYFFIHNTDESYSPQLCAYFIEQLNHHCGLSLVPPRLFATQTTLF